MTIFKIVAVIILGGVIIVTLIAYFYPTRLTTRDGAFRYNLAGFVVFVWPLSLLVLLLWSLTWPARKLVESGSRQYGHN
jgi:hypothetical protein